MLARARAAHILYKHSTNGNCENWKMTTFEDIIHLLFTLWSECELPELTRQSVGQVPTLENKHHPTIPIYYIYICWNIPPKIHTYVVTYRSFLNWFKSFANSTKDKNLEFHFSNVLDSVMQNKSKCKSWNRGFYSQMLLSLELFHR